MIYNALLRLKSVFILLADNVRQDALLPNASAFITIPP
jgi:hypothetical protein